MSHLTPGGRMRNVESGLSLFLVVKEQCIIERTIGNKKRQVGA